MKRGVVITAIILIIIVLALVFIIPRFTGYSVYAPNKIKINMAQETINPGENLTFSVEVYDDSNAQINTLVDISIEDANKNFVINKQIQSGKEETISLDKNAPFGYWKLVAKYTDSQDNKIEDYYLFNVEVKENVEFSLDGDVLKITNFGNSVYEKTIQIVIGDTIGTKPVRLDIGESMTLRLTAPEGSYNIRVTDGKNTITRSNVALTGNVIGILDSKSTSRTDITGGINPDQDGSFISFIKNKSVVYLFLAIIAGAAILLAVERNYRKKLGN